MQRFNDYQQLVLQHAQTFAQQGLDGLRALVESALSSQKAQELLQEAMQQWLAAASCVVSLALLLTTIAAGWFALWHTTMKDVGFFREIMGLNKPKPDEKAQRQAEVAAEIDRIKRQAARGLHSRSSSSRQP